MAQLTKLPRPYGENWKEYIHTLVQVLEGKFGLEEESTPGAVIVFSGALPDGYLPADGSTFEEKTYPALAHFLGGTTLPLLPAPPGFTLEVKAK